MWEPHNQQLWSLGHFLNLLQPRWSPMVWVHWHPFSSRKAHLDSEVLVPPRKEETLHF